MTKRLSTLTVLFVMATITTTIPMQAMSQAISQAKPHDIDLEANWYKSHDLAYDKSTRIISAWYQNYTICYTVTYHFDSHALDYTTAPVYTLGKPEKLESPEQKKIEQKIYYQHLLNRIRTYLILNGFKNQSPALAYMHQLFYAKTEIPEHKEAH